ncbi:MAG TPA: dTMP kinase [Candidatus Corynebacterium gallistercoris]|uniref:Thymidylate kinase n=1 Tax=Candidatus Corynebacterium gallistercoris TaxID=2838530 RepID=A0A9D1UQ92_9CORY|nr:dTMP kinase [Candidatus Corynebacterium gallistercoris]
MIIAFEGVDGAGKNTLVTAVEAELMAREVPVARVGFPRYEDSVHAALAQRALYGQMGDLLDSIHGMATLFALDRAEVAGELEDLGGDGYVVLLDRYVASNAAYSAARAGQDRAAETRDWVADLEFEQLGSPEPELQVLVDLDAAAAQERAAGREAADAARARDAYEKDSTLQERTVAAYRELAELNWVSPWRVVDSADGDVQARAVALADVICDMRR